MERRTRLDYASVTGRLRDYSQPSVRRLVTERRFNTQDIVVAKNRTQKETNPKTISQKKVQKSTTIKHPSIPRTVRSSVLSRKPLLPPPAFRSKKPINKMSRVRRGRKVKSALITTMAVIVFLFGIYASWHTWQTNEGVIAEVKSAQSSNTLLPGVMSETETPDETEVDDNSYMQYRVALNLPRYITIESIGVRSRVRPMGLTKDGAIQSPSSIYDAGWYEASAEPGEPLGAALIVGHVYGPTKSAIFSKLYDMKKGEIIDIERGDGLHVRYRVVDRDIYNRNETDMAKALRAYDPSKPGLNIITCHGKYDRAAKTYNQRLVVYAVAL